MKLDVLPWSGRPGIEQLLQVLDARGGVTRVVGGAVRDTLLGLVVADTDFATRLPPPEVVERLEAAGIKAVPTGIAHGTVTAVCAGRPYEITTLRRDVSTDGRRATVAFTDDWREDAGRRDFTINALYADPHSGALFDYFDGAADIAARRVRFIGAPLERIAEDHLRILRFFRFHARFGEGEPDRASLAACMARANDLLALSRERVSDEMLKLLALPGPGPTLELMLEGDVLAAILPEIERSGLAQLERLLEREGPLAPDPLRRLAALLPADATSAAAVAARLRLSNAARARLVCAAERQGEDRDQSVEALAYRLGPDCARDRIVLGDGDPAGVAALDSWSRPRLPIGGGALIARGLAPGPLVAATLHRIENAWVQAAFPSGAALDTIVDAALAKALRSTQ